MSYTQTAMQYAPWRRDIAWWIVLIQGIVFGGIGLYALVGDGAGQTIVMLLGLYALIHSLWIIFSSWRRPAESRALLQLVSAGVGLLAGAVVVFHSYFVNLPWTGALVVFALGLIITGLLGFLASFVIRQGTGFAWGVMVRGLIDLGLGLYLGYALRNQTGETAGAVTLIGWVGTIGGVLLIGYSIFLFMKARKTKSAESAGAASAAQPAASAAQPAASATQPAASAPAGSETSANPPAES
jgi:hypothetical protein